MSTWRAHETSAGSREASDANAGAFRSFALGGILVLTASYVLVLREVTTVVGGTATLYALVGAMLLAATLLARTVGPKTATVGAVVATAAGFGYYLTVAGLGVGAAYWAAGELLADTLTLVTGLSLLRVAEAGTWTLGFVPAPVFLSWYLALRREYALSVVPGGVALCFLVLTGDATLGTTAAGVGGAIAAVGFGGLEVRGGTFAQADVLALVFAATLVLSTTVTLVPVGSSGPVTFADGEEGTLEGTTTAAPEQAPIAGSVSLSPEVRFTVYSERDAYWRTGVYDRFTGDGWVRTGSERPYEGRLERPPGGYDTVRHTVVLEGDAQAMPVAPQPIRVEGEITENTAVTVHGQIRPDEPLIAGDTYTVESAVVDPSGDRLEAAGTDYPEEIGKRYLQTPEDTSAEFEEYTAEVTADAETPYEKAAAVERHLRTSKGYSLEVDRPEGNVAEAFLLEMEEGYCVYFATTMTQMLRAEDIPARYVVGYTSGQEVDDGEYVVRGTDAHAWVEVYFPGHGWVAFEPTPGEPREAVHDGRVEDAREDGEEGVDTDDSEEVPLETDESNSIETPDGPAAVDDGGDGMAPENTTDGPGNETDSANGSDPGDPTGSDPDEPTASDPSEPRDPNVSGGASGETAATSSDADGGAGLGLEDVALGAVVLVGLAAGARRTGLTARARREVRIHWQGRRGDPDDDVRRAYHRLESLLERESRPRRPTESVREYLEALSAREPLDPEVLAVARWYERAVYGDGVDRRDADDAIELVDALARRRTPIVHRLLD